MSNSRRPGPVVTRPMNEKDKEYFRKRLERMKKQGIKSKPKNWKRHA
ncbi:hypothetical protein [Gracilibacillus xinjiangensis]|uniref:30S ribosomal protein S21 n=1 Tax=Gracilibacillus xinjiangensis TaxID=1193282 RepID=A0ABV8WXH2_9BACI